MKAPEHQQAPIGSVRNEPRTPAPPGGRRRSAILTALALLFAAVVGGGAVYAWDRGRGADEQALERALHQRDAALDRVGVLTTRVAGLREELATESGRSVVLERTLERAEADLSAALGPRLEDGRHFGYLAAVGVTQDPPRLVFDLAEWFTDQEAVEAALEDGVPRQEAGINGYYIRNENPRWRILEVDPITMVTLSTYPIADPAHPIEVDLDRFSELFSSSEGYLPLSPYWLTVRDDVVVAIEEQFIP
ncbi:MAG TPA: hypothetical protein VF108_07930 [Actinomycetota bacterium]